MKEKNDFKKLLIMNAFIIKVTSGYHIICKIKKKKNFID